MIDCIGYVEYINRKIKKTMDGWIDRLRDRFGEK